ncbi:MAG TPA: hypothetical protein VMA31_07880 [Bryobacteraceae bacterium]|nr:hypothetical protein [Bryobacteraceae bacterium]
MLARLAPLLLFTLAAPAQQPPQQYDGPRPTKPDLPFLVQGNLVFATEALEARERKQKKDILFVIDGAASPARTHQASPFFLFEAERIVPETLGLYKLEVNGEQRQILFPGRKPPKPVLVDVTRLEGNLFKIEVHETLAPGEYALSPEGSNAVFCFAVY